MKKLLGSYFKLQREIHSYFGYQEDWVTIPLDDATEYYWALSENEQGGGEVKYHETLLTKDFIEGGGHYSAKIYTQRFLPKWVYRAEDYTLVCADTQVDGNKFLMIFDNAKECKEASGYAFIGWGTCV